MTALYRSRPRYKPLGLGKGLTGEGSDGTSETIAPPPPLPTSNFTTDGEAAWWIVLEGGQTRRCVANGLGVLAAMQSVIRSALRAPFTGPDGKTWTTRPDVDGNFGPHTAAGLWAYAKKSGMPQTTLDKLKADARAKTISSASQIAAIQVAYYRPRIIDLDVNGVREERVDPPILGVLANPDGVGLPTGAVLWNYLKRPFVPANLGTLAAQTPVCSLNGDGWSLEQITMNAPSGNRTTPNAPGAKRGGGLLWVLLALGTGYALSD